MVELVSRVLLDTGIVSLILASIVQVYADVSGKPMPAFLPPALARLRTAEPATALALAGLSLFVLGFLVEMVLTGLAPGGRIVVGLIAVISFLFAGGFVLSEDAEADADAEAGS